MTDFVEECKLMSQLHHPHIVQFLGVAYLPGSPIPVLLMEKLQTSLDNLLETSPNIPLDVKVHLLTGTLTQTFPKDLKPHTYPDPVIRRLVGRTEIERRDVYVQQMKTSLGEAHSLVKLTLDCLEHFAEDRPSAVEVSRRLEEIGWTVPQNCTETKLELIQQIQQNQVEHQGQINELQAANSRSQSRISRLQTNVDHLQADKQEQQQQIDHLKTENQKLTTVYQQQLDDKCREIERLSGRLRSLELQPWEEGSQGSRQRDVSVVSPKKVGPSVQVQPQIALYVIACNKLQALS